MKFIVTNAFSLNMLVREGQDIACIPVSMNAVQNLLAREIWESAVGHPDTARLFSGVLGTEVPANRSTVYLVRGETSLIVGQYTGARLPEGTTQLPEGARIDWWQVYHVGGN